ncbi:hypothetical protein R1A27_25710 [Methylobacterium sp. NMS12]|uniref:hypothetical protein n=1 Tax=Methylobacterium sp. NMS12 TaxID=3079766 RepID=UPI003F881C89
MFGSRDSDDISDAQPVLSSAIRKLEAVAEGRLDRYAGVLTAAEAAELRRLISALEPEARPVSIAPDGWDGQ